VVYTWGNGTNGRLGHGTTANVLSPQCVSSLQRVVGIAAGQEHALALTGVCVCVCVCVCVTVAPGFGVYTWGTGADGALGVGDEMNHHSPVRVEYLCGRGVRHVCAGYQMSGALLGPWCVFVRGWLCRS
jgi:alpha-tubulin suppressor-like RCC1 family protein